MKRAFTIVAVLAFLGVTSAAWGAMMPASLQKTVDFKEFSSNDKILVVFEDGFDPPLPGWTFADYSAIGPFFHPDPYNADPDIWGDCAPVGGPNGLSWWCGQFECSYAGGDGYGNSWNQWLHYSIPVLGYIPGGGDCLILTFHGRYDSESGFDFTYV